MNQNTFYIEYLIFGAIATLGLGYALDFSTDIFFDTGELGIFWPVAAIPVAYLLGIVVDGIGTACIEVPIEWIFMRNSQGHSHSHRGHFWLWLRSGLNDSIDPGRLDSRTAVIIQFNPELEKKLSQKRGRDRIVRGATVCLIGLGILLCGKSENLEEPLFAFIGAFILFCTWVYFFWRTKVFKDAAFDLAQEQKNPRGRTRGVLSRPV